VPSGQILYPLGSSVKNSSEAHELLVLLHDMTDRPQSDATRWRDVVTSGSERMRQLYELSAEDQTEGILWPACLVLLRHLETMDWCATP
jgi:hypothetical protein